MSRLRRFLSPQVAELVVSQEALLQPHRREITVVFCDLRGFTTFSETAEPEEALAVLRDYHTALGAAVFRYEGTLEHFAGDGVMVFFNDPVPHEDHALRAVSMAVDLRDRMRGLLERWRKRGHELGFGVGIATGHATLGRIGFEGRYDYGAVGNVTILAQRLSAEAKPGQILVSQRVLAAVEDAIETSSVGDLSLKGYTRPVPAFDVVGLRA
jgi:class 3 adenylate cyclase